MKNLMIIGFFISLVSCVVDTKKLDYSHLLCKQIFQEEQVFNSSTKNTKDSLKLKEALMYADTAIKLAPESPVPYIAKRHLLIIFKEYNKLLILLADFANKTKNKAEVLTHMGYVYERIGENELAQIKYKEAIKEYDIQFNKTHNVIFLLEKAKLFYFISQPQKAIEEYNKILKQNPDDKAVKAYYAIFNDKFKKEYCLNPFFGKNNNQ